MDFHNMKKKALDLYKELPMPSSKSESWKYTEICDLDLSQFSPAAQKIEFDFPDEAKENGIIFTDIKTAIKKHIDIIAENMPMGLVNVEEDKFTAMHAAFWDDGVFIYIPRNVELSMPLRNIFTV